MKNNYQTKKNENTPLWRNLLTLILLPAMMLVMSMGAMAQESVTTEPPLDIDNKVHICVGASVTVYVHNTDSDGSYRLSQSGVGILQTLQGTGGTITFNPVTYTSSGSYSHLVVEHINSAFFFSFTTVVYEQPVASTMTKSPDLLTVCAGQEVSATVAVAGTGGTGTCDNTYEFRTKTNDTWSDWDDYELGEDIETDGKTGVEIRALRNCDGEGCDEAENVYSWEVNPQPEGPSLNTASPSQGNVCEGVLISATFIAGTGGVGCVDEFQYSFDGSYWTNFVSGADIDPEDESGKTLTIQGRRASCTSGAGCDETSWETLATWQIFAYPVTIISIDFHGNK